MAAFLEFEPRYSVIRKRSRSLVAVLALWLSGCLQSVHRTGPSSPPVPGGPARVLEDRAGRGTVVIPGDQITVAFVGRYATGEVWGEGPLTLIVGAGTYPGLREPLRVGATIRMQYVTDPNDTIGRLVPFPGGDPENEAYQVRHDRGQIVVEHTVRRVCRPLKLFILRTGLGTIEPGLGCWPIPRAFPRRLASEQAAVGREAQGGEAAGEPPLGTLLDPPIVPRPAADAGRYLDEGGLHRAVRDARPEIVGWLLRRGRNVATADSLGFLPIHYVGWAQRPVEGYLPAFEQSYLDVVDTLLAHGAVIDAPVGPGRVSAVGVPTEAHQGQTALAFAAEECADRLVRRLLEHGASANTHAVNRAPPITWAARNGCPETVAMLLDKGANVELDPSGGGTPLERLIAVSAFHQGHLACARLLLKAGARRTVAAERLADRLRDPGQGSFGLANRPMARRILALLRD